MATERPQTLGEEIANSITHGLGLALSLAAVPLLLLVALGAHDTWRTVAAIVYSTTLVLLYGASTFYHALPGARTKEVFQRLDHAAIYLLIAGTYTPFVLVPLRGTAGWILFGIVWTLAVLGVTVKGVFGAQRLKRISTIVYVLMGWLVIGALKPLIAGVPSAGLWLLIAGGLCYTLGVVFFVWERLKYSHAIWHLFVLGGSVAHFCAVYWYVLPGQ
jgi:hemolysin III